MENKEKMYEELLSLATKKYTPDEVELIKKSYEFASLKHQGRARLNKTEYNRIYDASFRGGPYLA